MNPNPFASLNHFTVPLGIEHSSAPDRRRSPAPDLSHTGLAGQCRGPPESRGRQPPNPGSRGSEERKLHTVQGGGQLSRLLYGGSGRLSEPEGGSLAGRRQRNQRTEGGSPLRESGGIMDKSRTRFVS